MDFQEPSMDEISEWRREMNRIAEQNPCITNGPEFESHVANRFGDGFRVSKHPNGENEKPDLFVSNDSTSVVMECYVRNPDWLSNSLVDDFYRGTLGGDVQGKEWQIQIDRQHITSIPNPYWDIGRANEIYDKVQDYRGWLLENQHGTPFVLAVHYTAWQFVVDTEEAIQTIAGGPVISYITLQDNGWNTANVVARGEKTGWDEKHYGIFNASNAEHLSGLLYFQYGKSPLLMLNPYAVYPVNVQMFPFAELVEYNGGWEQRINTTV